MNVQTLKGKDTARYIHIRVIYIVRGKERKGMQHATYRTMFSIHSRFSTPKSVMRICVSLPPFKYIYVFRDDNSSVEQY